MAKTLDQLNKNLVKLQETGGVVMCDLRVAHKNLFKHLSEIYFWWAYASQQDNYLEDEYKKLARKFRTVTYGINFAPLL
jgi:Na+-transporting NADH:ubiquinone oxidoreductase subunit NqrF